MVSLDAVAKALRGLRGKTLVTFQSIGDLDGVCSALALKELFPGAEVRMIDSVNSQTKKLLNALGIDLKKIDSLEKYENIVLVDVSNKDLLGDWGEKIADFAGKKIVLDHHFHSQKLPASMTYIDSKKVACCEIVFELLKKQGKINQKNSLLLACGIIADSAFFKSASPLMFKALGELIEKSGKSYGEIMELISTAPDVSEKIAFLKSAGRARLKRAGDFLIAVSEAGSFELGCASALVSIGADFAFVGNAAEGRISGVKKNTVKYVNIGVVMERAGKILRGSGGGHENVGGATGKPELVDEALDACARLVEEELKKKISGIKIKEVL
jgi:nanoRNase/pAp phosphatase (c-di-AMP/oligoRNAs hydrolase)